MDELIIGRNAVKEALRSETPLNKVLLQKGAHGKPIQEIMAACKEKGLIFQWVDKQKLDQLTSDSHQGVVAYSAPFHYHELEELLVEREEDLVILLDGIQDPHNLGAIIRTAYAAGASGVVIPKRRAAAVTATVVKASAGAVAHMPVARVTNINQTIASLKDMGYWVIGADMEGDQGLFSANLQGKIALVMGSEGQGLSALVRKNCDSILSIPMVNPLNSLNASVAAGLIIYEVYRQRVKK